MTVSIDPDLVVEYVLSSDRAKSPRPVFLLKPLCGPDAKIAIAASVGTAEEKADAYYDVLRVCLVGWRDLQKKDGTPAPFELAEEVVRGKRRMVPSERTMRFLGYEEIVKLANAASDYSYLTSDDVKN